MVSIQRPHLISTIAALVLAGSAAGLSGPAQASADSLPAFTCQDRSGGTTGVTGTITAIRVAHHDGYDRMVIGFATSSAVPPYELHRQATASFTRDPSGLPARLDGSAGIRAVLRGSDIAAGVRSDLKPGLPEIREVANIGNFERVVSYGIGLQDQACFRAFELSAPSRLVIDVPTSPAPAASSIAPAPSTLPATGQPARAGEPAAIPLAATLLGLLALMLGLTMTLLRRGARR